MDPAGRMLQLQRGPQRAGAQAGIGCCRLFFSRQGMPHMDRELIDRAEAIQNRVTQLRDSL